MGKRRKARELVLQNLYAYEISGNPIESVIENMTSFESDAPDIYEFACSLLRKTIHNQETLDNFVIETVKNWKFERIALLDRLILRQALCEMLYFDEIPPKVTINEAIDLAKKFSTDDSGRFVNGILDAVLRKLKQENRLDKHGRGLLE